jgi:two-component system NtrC family sensor kinase
VFRRLANRCGALGRNLRHPAFLSTAAALLAVGALMAAALRVTYRREINDAQVRAANLAHLLEEQTIRNFQAVDLVLQGIADAVRSLRLPEHDPTFQEGLKRRLEFLPHVRALFVIGADGFIIHDTDHPSTPRVTLADRGYFKAHQRDATLGLHIGTPVLSRSIHRWFVSVSRRIERPDGSFGGIAVAAVEPAFYGKFYSELQLGPQDAVSLFHADGTLIARAPESLGLVGKKQPGLKLFEEHLPKKPRGTFISSKWIDGETHIVSYRTVGGNPLVVAAAVSLDAFLADWSRTVYAAVFGFALVAALSLTTASIVVQRRLELGDARRRVLATQRLEALGQMTGGIAHDFNNLLAVLDAGLRQVERHVADPTKVQTYIAAARQALARGSGLTSQLLAFAKRQDLKITTANLNSLLRELEPMLRQAAGSRVSITCSLDPNLPSCRVDRTQFDAALLNLVINARDAMPNGGSVEISTAHWTEPRQSNLLKPGRYVCVRVRDTGSGIPRELLSTVFEPFFTTKGDRGTGLGLAQVYGFMRQIGGDVRVSSEVGVGTTIDLLFPVAAGEPKEERPRASLSAS